MATKKPETIISRKEVEKHNKEGDGWVIINDHVCGRASPTTAAASPN